MPALVVPESNEACFQSLQWRKGLLPRWLFSSVQRYWIYIIMVQCCDNDYDFVFPNLVFIIELLDVLDHVIYSHTHVHVICMINSQTISCCTATNPRVLQKSTFHCVSNIVMGQINPDEFQLHNVLIYWCIFCNETFWVWVWVNLIMSYWITNVYFHNYLITHVFNQS